jgi:hypothetical protein
MRYLILIILGVIIVIWVFQRIYHDSEAEKAVDQTTDYLTGKTPANVLIQTTIRTAKIQIGDAVRLFHGMNGRHPTSLEELQEAGFISEEQKYIRYVNVKYRLLSGQTQDGHFFVRGVGPDQKEGTQDDWVEVF